MIFAVIFCFVRGEVKFVVKKINKIEDKSEYMGGVGLKLAVVCDVFFVDIMFLCVGILNERSSLAVAN